MFSINNNVAKQEEFSQVSLEKTFMSKVFLWMGLALAITAFTAYYFISSPELIGMLINKNGLSGLGIFVAFSPFIFALLMTFGFKRFSVNVLMLLYGVFSVLMGMSLSFILLVYTSSTVYTTFAVTSLMFGVMAVAGYTTKIDLTKFGSLMFMGLIGIIIASIANFFMNSSSLEYVISFIGVVVFAGLTAYDVQKLKKIGAGIGYENELHKKLIILSAFTLYLDFINLFLFLLRFLGNRR